MHRALLSLHESCADDDEEAIALASMNSAAAQLGSRPAKKRRGGSYRGRAPNIDRDHEGGHERLFQDYFAEQPVYPENIFRRRFRMSRRLFLRLHDAVVAHDDYFIQRPDATGKVGLSSLQKITAAMRICCYGVAADATDEYLRIGESTAMESCRRFAHAVVACFENEYMRQPNHADLERQLRVNAARGFPGMFGSLDCTHWVWKNCPVGLQGQFQDRKGNRSIILEAVASQNLWIWHAFLGLPGSNNDLNVLDRSPLMTNWLQGSAPSFEYEINGNPYDTCYLLCDGIYPSWGVFVKTISPPANEKQKYFARKQEAVRKDVERCFGVLRGRFAVLAQPARFWDHSTLVAVWKACIIMHNMVVEDEEDDEGELARDPYFESEDMHSVAQSITLDQLLIELAHAEDTGRHVAIRDDLVEHLWARKLAKRRMSLP